MTNDIAAADGGRGSATLRDLIARLEKALVTQDETFPGDGFGESEDGQGEFYTWPLKDELLDRIDKALTETSRCPHPAKGDPDNTTVRECIGRGHCGCDNAKARERT